MCGVMGTRVHCWWWCKMGQPLWKNSMEVSRNIKNRITRWFSNPILGNIPKRIETRLSKRHLYTHVHSSIIHNSQEVDATHMFISGWMAKEKVVSMHVMGYHAALKRRKFCHVPQHRWTSRTLGQSQKDKYCMLHLIGSTWSSQNYRNRK